MPAPEAMFRQAAAAAFRRSQDLRADADLLARDGRYPSATALAIVGIEEFSKAMIWAVVAVLPEQGHRLEGLKRHAVRQRVVELTGIIEIEINDASPHLTPTDRLVLALTRLSESGLQALLSATTADEDRKGLKEIAKKLGGDDDLLLGSDWKDAALYVDIRGERILTPDRVDHGVYQQQALSLMAYHELYGALESITDRSRWAEVRSAVRRAIGGTDGVLER